MRILHVMDPIGGIDITKDTSFVFIREAQERGHDNHYCGIADLAVRNGTLSARAAKLTVTEVQGEHSTLGPHAWQDAESFDAVFMCKDPPFDTDFFFATHLLSLIDQTKTLVFNRPEGLREATEKLFILRFPDLITETIVSANSEELLAFGRTTGDIVIIQDADLELDPSEYPDLLAPILRGDAKAVYGSRFTNGRGATSLGSYIGNLTITWATNLLFFARLTDIATGYKVIRRDVLDTLRLSCNGFDFDAEITNKLLKAGVRIHEVPVSYAPRDHQAGKKLHWSEGLRVLLAILRNRFTE